MYTLEDGFGNRLKEERIRHAFTQEQLAKNTGVSTLSISQYEQGKSYPSIKFIYTLQELKFDVIYIMLAVSGSDYARKYSAETYEKVIKEIDLLELKVGGNLNTAARVKLTETLLNHFEDQRNVPTENSQTIDWLSQILSKL